MEGRKVEGAEEVVLYGGGGDEVITSGGVDVCVFKRENSDDHGVDECDRFAFFLTAAAAPFALLLASIPLARPTTRSVDNTTTVKKIWNVAQIYARGNPLTVQPDDNPISSTLLSSAAGRGRCASANKATRRRSG